jgi:hypothetical protein
VQKKKKIEEKKKEHANTDSVENVASKNSANKNNNPAPNENYEPMGSFNDLLNAPLLMASPTIHSEYDQHLVKYFGCYCHILLLRFRRIFWMLQVSATAFCYVGVLLN